MADDWEGLDPDFVGRLQRLNEACPFSLTSGRRTNEEQRQLYEAWSEGRHRVPVVAKPGTSRHESGFAADIRPADGNYQCFQMHAPGLGLHFPVKGEPWHAEPVGARGPDGAAEADTGPPADPVAAAEAAFMKVATGSEGDPMDNLAPDPVEQGEALAGGNAMQSTEGGRIPADQIAKTAYEAGFRGEALVTAVAVALAESSGRPDANAEGEEDSRGLWQINVDPNEEWGRARAAKYGDLYNPTANARAAFDISGGGQNWGPWSMYTNGRYRDFLSAARTAAMGLT